MQQEKYIPASEITEDAQIKPGHKIKIYGFETIVKGFYGTYNEGLEKWETIIITEGRGGEPFERTIGDIEILPGQPYEPVIAPARSNMWVKCSDRLPGYETPVKWRDGNDHTHVTDGKIPLINMAKPFLVGWEWYDEQPVEQKEWDSKRLIGRVKDRFKELEEKKWEWRSFYNGWLEGRVDMLSENKGWGMYKGEQKENWAVDIDELWDEYSEMIDDDIDSLSRWAGSVVMSNAEFIKAIEQYQKQNKQ